MYPAPPVSKILVIFYEEAVQTLMLNLPEPIGLAWHDVGSDKKPA
jgi:hypothetical protein